MVNILKENDLVTICVEGHIDSSNADKIEREIFDNIDFSLLKKIIINAEKLEYISSAGLRLILKMRKLCEDLNIIEVSSAVYEIFEMTGFSEMLNIEKAYRKLSVDGCEILGEGSNGVVYKYDDEIIVKVYKNADALADIKRERALARRALILGIPTAIPFDVVKVGNTYGSVFELLNAKSFSKLIVSEPEKIDYYIGLFVDLIKKIHSTEVEDDELTDMKQTAISWAEYLENYIDKNEYNKLISMIKAVPDRNTMIHGDYHTNNVEMQDGEVILIDMDTLSFGHPVFELASMFLGFVGFTDLNQDNYNPFLKMNIDTAKYVWEKTIELYFDGLSPEKIEENCNKAKIIGYTRLLRRTIKRIGFDDPEGLKLINHCKAQLSSLLAKVDNLEF